MLIMLSVNIYQTNLFLYLLLNLLILKLLRMYYIISINYLYIYLCQMLLINIITKMQILMYNNDVFN